MIKRRRGANRDSFCEVGSSFGQLKPVQPLRRGVYYCSTSTIFFASWQTSSAEAYVGPSLLITIRSKEPIVSFLDSFITSEIQNRNMTSTRFATVAINSQDKLIDCCRKSQFYPTNILRPGNLKRTLKKQYNDINASKNLLFAAKYETVDFLEARDGEISNMLPYS